MARPILTGPALILADEPTGNLDPVCALDILGLFAEIHEGGTTVLVATHEHAMEGVAPRRLLVLDGGRCIEARKGLSGLGGALERAPTLN